MSTSIPTRCDDCGAQLNAHNITRLCAECKTIARHERCGWRGSLHQSRGTGERHHRARRQRHRRMAGTMTARKPTQRERLDAALENHAATNGSEISAARTSDRNSDDTAGAEALTNGSEIGNRAPNSDDSPSVSADLEPLDFAGLLDLLGFGADDRLGLTAEAKNRCGVAERDRVIKVAAEYTHTDCWFGINPTTCRRPGGRGTNAEVSRLAALVADLDDEKMFRAGTDAIIAEISALIGPPSAITESGHGRQPYWPLDRSDAEHLSNGEAAALAERFGILITRKAAGKRGSVDTVDDLARMLRVPGSTNRKKPAEPRLVTCSRDRRGDPVKIADLLAALDAEKIPAVDPAEAMRDVVSAPADWTFTAGMECKWLATKIGAWPTDEIRTTRHNWLGAAAPPTLLAAGAAAASVMRASTRSDRRYKRRSRHAWRRSPPACPTRQPNSRTGGDGAKRGPPA